MVVTGALVPRLNREECTSTKHDSVFSEWEILIGPSDWEDYSLGKEGVERYRIHNLPIRCSCPGLYELGVAILPGNEGRNPHKHHSDEIVVVYIGEAENIRTRLQHYGRAGSHLDHGNSIKGEGVSLQKCPGLFKEIFSRGGAVLFRWALMGNKKEAEQTEAKLLGDYDYAWNTRANGFCRREDILSKLDAKGNWGTVDKIFQKHLAKTTKSPKGSKVDGFIPKDLSKCGASLADGSICMKAPVPERKRCELHKGRKAARSTLDRNKLKNNHGSSSESYDMKRTIIKQERNTVDLDTKGNWDTDDKIFQKHLAERIKSHQGSKINGFIPEDLAKCGASLADGSICMEAPVRGRKRCELHKWRKAAQSALPRNKLQNNQGSYSEFYDMERAKSKQERNTVDLDIKGKDDKIFQNHPVTTRTRCKFVSGNELSSSRSLNLLACGVNLGGGNFCMNLPVHGRKRCQQHKGWRVT